MSVIRVNKTENYTVMSNTHLRQKDMSLKAKGLLSVMLSLPPSWDYSIAGLVAICKESTSAVESTLAELKKLGYLCVTKLMPNETATGRIEYVYDIYEQPQAKQEGRKQEAEKQGVENQPLEIQPLENQGQLNTKGLNTQKLNTDKSKESQPAPSEIVEMYNSICVSYPKILKLTPARVTAIKARLADYSPKELQDAFRKMEQSSFLRGGNDRGWKATFDWAMKPSNIAKIIEGNYDNHDTAKPSPADRYANIQEEETL